MSKSVFVGNTPKINLDKIGGDISIVGWDGADLLIKADDDETRFEQTPETVSVSCSGDLALRIPTGAVLALKSVGGDAAIRGVLGAVTIQEIDGCLSDR